MEKCEDDYTKTKGGDMDWMGKGRFYPTEVEKPAMELKVGEISGLVKSTQGYHIVKVEGRRFSPDKHWTTYVEGQKKKAKIEVMDPALAAYRQVSEDEGKAQKALADAKSDADRKKAEDLQKQNRAKALAAYEKAVEKSEDPYLRAALLYAMGEMHTKDGNTTKAAEMFAAATDAMPSADIYMALGDAQHKLKKDAAAVESYKQASEMAQDTSQSMGRQNEGLHLRLMTAFKDLKQPQLAAQESAWLAKYRQEQAASGGGMGGFPGGSFTVGN